MASTWCLLWSQPQTILSHRRLTVWRQTCKPLKLFSNLYPAPTILIKRVHEFVVSYDGVPEGPQGAFHPPQTPKTCDDFRSSLQAYLVEQLPPSIMGSNPGDKKFPWGQLPVKLLQAGCSLVQWPDGEMFDYYKLFKAQSVKSVPDSVFKALWQQTVKLPPNQRPQVQPLRGKDDDDLIISSVSGTMLVSVVQA